MGAKELQTVIIFVSFFIIGFVVNKHFGYDWALASAAAIWLLMPWRG